MRRSNAAAWLAASLICALPRLAPAQPHLLFSPADEAAIQARTQSGVPAAALKQMAASCSYTALDSDFGECTEEAAFRYRILGDVGAGDAAVSVLVAAAADDPKLLYDSWASNNHSMYAFGPIASGMALSYDMVRDRMSATQRQAVVASLEKFAELIWGWTGKGAYEVNGNYEVSAYAALGLVGLSIEGESAHPDREAWVAAAAKRIGETVFRDSWNPGGSYDEGYGYSYYGSPLALRFAVALQRAKNVDLIAGTNVVGAPRWFVHGFFPHQAHVALCDSHKLEGRAFAGEYLMLADRLDPGFVRWGWHFVHGASGLEQLNMPFGISKLLGVALYYPSDAPEWADPLAEGWPHDALFHDTANGPKSVAGSELGKGGTAFFRSGWSTDSVAASFRVMDEWVNHGHADSGSFTLSAYGSELAVDPGYYVTSSDAHNVVQVDWWTQNKGWRRSYHGVLERFFSGRVAGYARADVRYPWGQFVFGAYDDIAAYTPLERAVRTLLFVRGATPFAVVFDDLADAQDHSYRFRLHSPATASGSAKGSGVPGDPLLLEQAKGPVLELTFTEPAAFSLEKTPAKDGDGKNLLSVTAATPKVTSSRFATLLLPKPTAGAPSPTVTRLELANGSGMRLDWSGAQDVVLVRTEPGTLQSAGLTTDARALLVHSESSNVTGLFLVEGSSAEALGQTLVDAGSSVVSVSWAGALMEVEGQAEAFEIYGPTTQTLQLNGQSVAFSLSDAGMVIYPPLPGSGGSGGAGGSSGGGNGGSASGGSGSDAGDSGCGCRLGVQPSSRWLVLLLALSAILVRRRDRRGARVAVRP